MANAIYTCQMLAQPESMRNGSVVDMILCPKCFTPNDDNAKFCAKCGNLLSQQIEEKVVEETTILEPQIDFGSNSGRMQSESSASLHMGSSATGASATYAHSTGNTLPDSGAGAGNGGRAATSKTGIIALAIAAVSVVLAIACLFMLLTSPKASENVNQPAGSESATEPEKTIAATQPDRWENLKTDALLVDLNDRNAACNLPGGVITEDASTISNLPSEIKEGRFYALWDCDVLTMKGDDKTHLLVTMRELHPIPGRVWTNWYNWNYWTGWKATKPS